MKERNINLSNIIFNVLKAFLGGVLCAIALKIFVNNANIVPAGFSGITVLIQRAVLKYFNISLPFAPVNLLLNLPPAILALKMISRRYTILSVLVLMEISILTDLLPNIILIDDRLILSVFGAIISATGASLVFQSGVCTGGTDFIAMSVSNKYHISTFKYVMTFNIGLIILQGILFGFDASFYSIIYQYCNTQVLNMRYKHYEKKTLFIITDKPNEVSQAIIKHTKHSVTKIDGEGCFSGAKRNFLYTITTTPELKNTMNYIKEADKDAFINILNSTEVEGKFSYLPVDKPE